MIDLGISSTWEFAAKKLTLLQTEESYTVIIKTLLKVFFMKLKIHKTKTFVQCGSTCQISRLWN